MSAPSAAGFRKQAGVNVIGVLSAGTGIGAAGRSTLRVLGARGIPHVAADMSLNVRTFEEPLPSGTEKVDTLANLPFGASVIQLNPDMFDVLALSASRRLGLDLAPTVNALVPFWELPALPENWVSSLRFIDIVLAPTAFVRDAVERSLAPDLRPEVWDYPQALRVPRDVAVDRKRWFCERAETTVFLLTFDIMSDIERKNPWAVVDAFQRAFADRQDVSLFIKVNHATAPEYAERYRRLEDLAVTDQRVALIDQTLSREDMWSLSASADAYVSLHRAEGLGLGMMESMAVGTPVIATGWSGNVDFMDESNSISVPYSMVPVEGVTSASYTAHTDQQWADPDIDAAASALRELADSAELRTRLGEGAAHSMRERWERQALPGVFDRLLEATAAGMAGTPLHADRVRAAQAHVRAEALAPARLAQGMSRAAVGALRALHLKAPAPPDEFHWPGPRVL